MVFVYNYRKFDSLFNGIFIKLLDSTSIVNRNPTEKELKYN